LQALCRRQHPPHVSACVLVDAGDGAGIGTGTGINGQHCACHAVNVRRLDPSNQALGLAHKPSLVVLGLMWAFRTAARSGAVLVCCCAPRQGCRVACFSSGQAASAALEK
jgi:hypothetical protein